MLHNSICLIFYTYSAYISFKYCLIIINHNQFFCLILWAYLCNVNTLYSELVKSFGIPLKNRFCFLALTKIRNKTVQGISRLKEFVISLFLFKFYYSKFYIKINAVSMSISVSGGVSNCFRYFRYKCGTIFSKFSFTFHFTLILNFFLFSKSARESVRVREGER